LKNIISYNQGGKKKKGGEGTLVSEALSNHPAALRFECGGDEKKKERKNFQSTGGRKKRGKKKSKPPKVFNPGCQRLRLYDSFREGRKGETAFGKGKEKEKKGGGAVSVNRGLLNCALVTGRRKKRGGGHGVS